MKKLIPAIGMLAVSGMMLASSTYAWFTMNKTVTVTGMQLKTSVGGNLLICDSNVEAEYTTALTQSVKGILEPVSTINAKDGSFWYTVNAFANGAKSSGNYSPYADAKTALAQGTDGYGAYTDAFSKDYNVSIEKANAMFDTTVNEAKGYVDYTFYLKATADTANQQIVMSECNLLYNNAAIADSAKAAVDKDNAWRIAVFASDITNDGGKGTRTNGTLTVADGNVTPTAGDGVSAKAILTRAGAANQTAGNAVNGANSTDAVTYNTWTANIGEVATAGASKYYKVVVRVWLEGEDTSCKSSTYALLTNQYTLAAKFDLINQDTSQNAYASTRVATIESDTSKVGYVSTT